MFALLRLMFIGFIVLTVVYVVVSLWARSACKRALRREWDEDGMTGDRDAFVDAGLKDYDGSLRRKLILGVYIVPILLIATIVYMTNFM